MVTVIWDLYMCHIHMHNLTCNMLFMLTIIFFCYKLNILQILPVNCEYM